MSKSKQTEFENETNKDIDLKEVVKNYVNGWPTKCENSGVLTYYFKIRNNISVENNLVYYDDRLVVPKSLRKYILNLVLETHLGIRKTKQIVKWYNVRYRIIYI